MITGNQVVRHVLAPTPPNGQWAWLQVKAQLIQFRWAMNTIVYASECKPCECCGEPICPHCNLHYADCPCPGPHSEE